MILFWYDFFLCELDDITNRVMMKIVSIVITVYLKDLVSVVKLLYYRFISDNSFLDVVLCYILLIIVNENISGCHIDFFKHFREKHHDSRLRVTTSEKNLCFWQSIISLVIGKR